MLKFFSCPCLALVSVLGAISLCVAFVLMILMLGVNVTCVIHEALDAWCFVQWE